MEYKRVMGYFLGVDYEEYRVIFLVYHINNFFIRQKQEGVSRCSQINFFVKILVFWYTCYISFLYIS